MNQFEIDVAACRGRQQRLIEVMRQCDWDVVIVTQPEHVQWLAGPRYAWLFQPAAALTIDGHLTLVAPQQGPPAAAADTVLTYEAKWHSTLRNDQRQASMEVLDRAISDRVRGGTLGVEFSSFGRHSTGQPRRLVDVEDTLYQLRRRKDPDELALLKKAIAGTARMYELARSLIEPGISELELFSQLQAVAVEEFGEPLHATGNDYQCGSRGGPPRNGRRAAPGELYILDLGPAFRGYFADNARTVAVTSPSDEQHEAWTHVLKALQHVQHTARPGVRCKQLFEEVQGILDAAPIGEFNHHLGHGIGLFPHEAPHLNPHWDDTLQEGDVFTAEPGLYAPQLRAGMRIENDFLVTADGVELLTDFSPEL